MTELEFVNLIIQQASSAQSGNALQVCDTILNLAKDQRRNVTGKANRSVMDEQKTD